MSETPNKAHEGGRGHATKISWLGYKRWIAALLAAALLIGATVWIWRKNQGPAPATDLPSSAATAAPTAAEFESLRQRLNDAQKVNALLREQSLALTQRLSLVEDAIANMSRGLAPAASSMKLEEAEYLLSLAQTRLELFKDLDHAQRAMELADLQLAGINDPRLARVRQTLAIELDALRATPRTDKAGISAAITALSAKVDALPIQTDENIAPGGRVRQLLDRYLVIRREGEIMPVVGRSPWAVREGLKIEFERAQLSLERQDATLFHEALTTAQSMAEQALVQSDTRVREFSIGIAALRERSIQTTMPALGASLTELKTLRGAMPSRSTKFDSANDEVQISLEPETPNEPTPPASLEQSDAAADSTPDKALDSVPVPVPVTPLPAEQPQL